MNLYDDITYLKGVGPKRSEKYAKLGIKNVSDLLSYYPRDHIDFTKEQPISSLEIGKVAVVKAIVMAKLSPRIFNHISIYKVVLSDGSDEIVAVIFNSEFSYNKLVQGKEFILYGKIAGNVLQKEIHNPEFILADDPIMLRPKYPLTAGMTNNFVMDNVRTALQSVVLDDLLPDDIRKNHDLMDYPQAVKQIHFPDSMEKYSAAKRRLVFDEWLSLQLGLFLLKNRNRKLTGAMISDTDISEFVNQLPFQLTNAQQRSIDECLSDLQKRSPMNRLLQGDVGSGKTVVAAAVAYSAAKNGFQSAIMAPTEILAMQHYQTLSSFFEGMAIKVALLTGSNSASEKRRIKEQLKSGEIDIIIGTQALIQKSVVFHNLGLVVTDEQHRFGVGQRSALIAKGINPHNLVMSATPIPRTLALMIYGDLDISLVDEMPKGRIPIKTYSVNTSYRKRLYDFIMKHVEQGYQAYIVCPMIDENDDGKNERSEDVAAAIAYYENISTTYLRAVKVGLLHGKLKQDEKDKVMSDFKENKINVLVSTTVIEVGVDVPNAVIMLVENAEYFGLSQLHQLRGRVGRGKVQSFCVLLTDNESEYTKSRMKIMTDTADGFVIANEDLKLRGPGDFFGNKQHGLPQLKIANMAEDTALLYQVQATAREVLDKDPALEFAEHKGLRIMADRLFNKGDENGFN